MLAARSLGELGPAVDRRLAHLADERVVERIWQRDHTVWRDDPTEISNRLGWLEVPERATRDLPGFEAFAAEVIREGFTDVVLLGMGGSSLAPEVLARTIGSRSGVRLVVLDTTHPDAIAAVERDVDPARTLFLVASKSGTTIETRSHMAYFLDRVGDASRFVAITDPGTPLAEDAMRLGFRQVFEAPPDVGGRYSALTPFGLVPGALIGANIRALLDGSRAAADACRDDDVSRNPGASLGAALGEAALAGRDKCTFVDVGGSLAALGTWAEQLLAESTGKEGKGIVPVDGEALGADESYGDDRLFVSLGDVPALEPFVSLGYRDPEQLGHAFFALEFATAVVGYVLGIQPFDQPDVQEAKDRASEVLAAGEPGDEPITPVHELLAEVRAGDYVAIQAFVSPWSEAARRLPEARLRIRDRLRVATTLGLGPRFLHSTGQLHKGGAGTGVFLQVFEQPRQDVPIPGRPFTFGTLIAAQASGDLAALRARGRRAGRVRLDELLGWSG